MVGVPLSFLIRVRVSHGPEYHLGLCLCSGTSHNLPEFRKICSTVIHEKDAFLIGCAVKTLYFDEDFHSCCSDEQSDKHAVLYIDQLTYFKPLDKQYANENERANLNFLPRKLKFCFNIKSNLSFWHKHVSNLQGSNSERQPVGPITLGLVWECNQSQPASARWAGPQPKLLASSAAIDERSFQEDDPTRSPRVCVSVRAAVMVSHSLALPIICFTTLWTLVGVVAPFLVPKGPNRG